MSPPRASSPALTLALPPRLRVLVVEDDEALARALTRALDGLGASTTVAGTATEARSELARGARFDAILVDVGLPDASGFDVLREVRARGLCERALVMTGQASPAMANEAQLLGAEMLYKPFETQHLRVFLDRCRSTFTSVATVLSPIERRIVELARRGRGRKESADALGISENTLKTHTKRLLAKTADPSLAVLCARLFPTDRPGRSS